MSYDPLETSPTTFSIHVDRDREYIKVHLHGMMTIDEVADYIAELKRQFTVHRLRSYVMMIDVTDCLIQSQDMIRAMAIHMATMPKARALAIITDSSLARMQVRRLFTQSYARIASTSAEGRAWVLSGVEPVV